MTKRWILGLFAGTVLVWVTSPLFVRSYHSKVYDPVFQDWVYPRGTAYRWRSEGYATTVFGPHGMPGRHTLAESNASRVIALWGDSQAEGVCVDDEDKLWRVLQRRLADNAGSVDVLPLAHSGDDAADWTREFDGAESQLGATEHLLLVCELDDLMPLAQQVPESVTGMLAVRSDRMLDVVPDFAIHAARGVIFQDDSVQLRRLRFGIGPVTADLVPQPGDHAESESFPAHEIAARLAGSTSRPITVLYAPRVPVIMGGDVRWDDPQNASFESLTSELRELGVRVIDCRDSLWKSAKHGVFPHGFQNGVIGNGHLNAAGYRAIAAQLAGLHRQF